MTSAAPGGTGGLGVVWRHVRRRENLPYLIAFTIIYLSWGSTFLAMRIGVTHLPALLFAVGAFAAGRRAAVAAGTAPWRAPAEDTARIRIRRFFGIAMITLPNGAAARTRCSACTSNEVALLNASLAFWIVGLGTLGPLGQQVEQAQCAWVVARLRRRRDARLAARCECPAPSGGRFLVLVRLFRLVGRDGAVSQHAAWHRADRFQRLRSC